MVRKMWLLIMLSFCLGMGGWWALQAQDPAPQKPVATPQTTTAAVDLSGTYAGTFNCEAAGLVGDTTLTINGSDFTTADGKSGHITASKTNGYTAVALQLAGADAATAKVISLRAKKSGSKLTLTPIAGATDKCTFVPSKSSAKNQKTQTPAATGTEVANPVPAESPMQRPKPSPSPSPTPSPSGSPTPNPSPEEPMPSPTPSPSPSPSPGYVS